MLSSAIYAANLNTTKASAASFNDVSTSFWGYSNIQWDIENKVIDGYPDGSFKPSQNVEQAEFIAMLVRAFQPSDFDPTSETGEWSVPYTRYANKMGWNLRTPSSLGGHKSSIYLNRGMVAEYLANATGKKYSIEDSIQYLLDLGLSDGKTENSLSGFQKGDQVTRIEAITFIQRLKKQLNTLQASPSTEEKYVPLWKAEAVQTAATINLTANTSMYQAPSDKTKKLGELSPQSLKTFEKWNNWYHIHAWMGDAWVYVTPENSADFNVIDPNDKRAAANVKTSWDGIRNSGVNVEVLLKEAPFEKNDIKFDIIIYNEDGTLNTGVRNCVLENMSIGGIQSFYRQYSGYVPNNAKIVLQITSITEAKAQP